jgi:Tfp pilus assembly protein PilO
MQFLLSIISIALAAAVFVGYVHPTYQVIQGLQSEVVEFDEALTKAKELRTLLTTLADERNAISEEQLQRLEKLLPDHIDSIRLVMDTDNIASRYGMRITNVRLDKQTAQSTAPYGSMVLNFSVPARYETFQEFLDNLEESLRLVDVVSLSFTAPGANSTTMVSVGLRTYWLK